MRTCLVSILCVVLVSVASHAEEPDPQAVIDFVLRNHWEHARPLIAIEGDVAVDHDLSAWRTRPDEGWLRSHVSGYAADFVAQFSALRSDTGRLDSNFPTRVTQMNLSPYRDGRGYDWPRLLRQHPSIEAVVEVTPPVFSLDGRVAVIGYFSIEPLGTYEYFTAVRLNSMGEWEWGVTSATTLREDAP